MDATESKRQLLLLAGDAQDTARWMFQRTSGSWESRRLQLLDTIPGVVAFYAEGSAALAADFYDESRSKVKGERFSASPVILDRTVRIRRGVVWASEPLSVDDDVAALTRLEQVMSQEAVRPYRDTTLENRKRDPEAADLEQHHAPRPRRAASQSPMIEKEAAVSMIIVPGNTRYHQAEPK